MHEELIDLLLGLDGVRQSPRCSTTRERAWTERRMTKWADLLQGLMSDRVVWLVRHHLDLLRDPRRTRCDAPGTPELRDLECLRRWARSRS